MKNCRFNPTFFTGCHCLYLRTEAVLRPLTEHFTNGRLMASDTHQKDAKGIPDEHTAREGLFDIIQKSKSHYQKRAYQCIKLLVALFSQCEVSTYLIQ